MTGQGRPASQASVAASSLGLHVGVIVGRPAGGIDPARAADEHAGDLGRAVVEIELAGQPIVVEAPGESVAGGASGDAGTFAPVSQPVEEVALKAIQSGFEPQRGHGDDAGVRNRPRTPQLCCTNAP